MKNLIEESESARLSREHQRIDVILYNICASTVSLLWYFLFREELHARGLIKKNDNDIHS